MIYVAPDGNANNNGTVDFPMDLLTGKNTIADGGTLIFKDGTYTVSSSDNLHFSDKALRTTLRADSGAKPVIVGSTGFPPSVYFGDNITVQGLWLGGARESLSTSTTITVGDNVIIDGCTFFGYYGGIAEGGHTGNTYQNNRFINCGGGGLYHDIYISQDNSGAHIYDNIHIGGEGYKIHLWHAASNVDIRRNFCAECYYHLVLQKTDQSAIDNIFWNHTPPSGSWFTVNIGAGIFTHNLFGHRTFGTGKWDDQMNGETGLTVDGLGLIGDRYLDTETWPGNEVYVGPYNGDGHVLPAPGTNYTRYAVTDLPTLLGYSEAQIDAAVSALIASFGASLETILADDTIESSFAILRACVDAWKAA